MGGLDYGAIELILKVSGVSEEEFSECFHGVLYYLLAYQAGQYSKQQPNMGVMRGEPQRKVLGIK